MQGNNKEPSRLAGWERPRWLVRGLRGIELMELTVGVVLVAAMVVFVMMQVISRVTPMQSYVWTGELARFSLLWLAFGLAGYLMGRDGHIALDAVDHVLPSLWQRVVKVFSLLVVAATAAMFGYEGLDLVTAGSPIKSPATGIPQAWIYVIPTAGMLLTILRALIEIILPAQREGQIRVAGEVIDAPDDADLAATGRAALDEGSVAGPSTGTVTR